MVSNAHKSAGASSPNSAGDRVGPGEVWIRYRRPPCTIRPAHRATSAKPLSEMCR